MFWSSSLTRLSDFHHIHWHHNCTTIMHAIYIFLYIFIIYIYIYIFVYIYYKYPYTYVYIYCYFPLIFAFGVYITIAFHMTLVCFSLHNDRAPKVRLATKLKNNISHFNVHSFMERYEWRKRKCCVFEDTNWRNTPSFFQKLLFITLPLFAHRRSLRTCGSRRNHWPKQLPATGSQRPPKRCRSRENGAVKYVW